MFLVAVGFWNFLGAGVFGFLINLPIVSYPDRHRVDGQPRTCRHDGCVRHAGVGLAMFALRYAIPADKWPEKAASAVSGA